jgi:hypothetical protein
MGNRKRGYKPNSRTRQKRAATRREWELDHLEDDVEQADARPGRAPSVAGAGRPLLSRLFNVERRPPTPAERDETPWSRRGLLTMSLIAAILVVPLGSVAYFSDKQHPYAYYIVGLINPAALLPLYLALVMLVAMPLARMLAKEPRSLRILETLGYTATVQILLIFFWTPVFRDNEWFNHGDALVGAACADVGALVGGAIFYPQINKWLLRHSRRPRR